MKERKYIYLIVIQANYGYGWDDLSAYDTNKEEDMKEFRSDYKAYKENERCLLRSIRRRQKVTKQYCNHLQSLENKSM